jgi:GxxExxY protein
MKPISAEGIDSLTERIIGCGIAVHAALGPGLLESIYRDALAIELELALLKFEMERRVKVTYRGRPVAGALEIDLLVEGSVVVEIKAVERVHPVHLAQVITYLKLTGCPAGLLMNFNATSLRAGLKRLDHPDVYIRRHPPSKSGPNARLDPR